MDQITQDLPGAALPKFCKKKNKYLQCDGHRSCFRHVSDLDIMTDSFNDPKFLLRNHHHFTHLISFIPFSRIFDACLL